MTMILNLPGACQRWVCQAIILMVMFTASESLGDSGPEPVVLHAQLQAVQHTVLSSEMAGKIEFLKIREGMRFKKGQLLVQMNCKAVDARASHAEATLNKKQKIFDVNTQLEKLNSISMLELEISSAEVDEAKANVALARAMSGRCEIRAPFSGAVVALEVRNHQFVGEGQPLMEIYDTSALEVEVLAPSSWLTWLKPGHDFLIVIDETKQQYKGHVVRIGAKVDPVSHSVRVFGSLQNSGSALLPGMSGKVHMTVPASPY